jgi:sulfite exporter TauE/SafE
MCGGVVSLLSSGLTQLGRKPRDTTRGSVRLVLGYNAGRIASYSVAGFIAGTFGSVIDRIPILHGAELGLRLAAGLLMLGLGLYVAGAWTRFAAIERAGVPLWRRIEPIARRLLPVRSLGAALGLGALWGWMPCGLVYAALGLARGTGSGAGGALTMAAFGAGTLPMLLTMGALAQRVAQLTRIVWVRRAAGLAIVAFGVLHVAAAGAQIARPRTASCCAGHHAPAQAARAE